MAGAIRDLDSGARLWDVGAVGMRGTWLCSLVVLACSSQAPAPTSGAASSGAPTASGTAAARAPEDVAPPLLLDTRVQTSPSDVDPIVATMEPLPPKYACATLSTRGRRLRRMPQRTADTYAKCKAVLDTSAGGDLLPCIQLMKLLESAPRDEVLRDNIAARACARGSLPACRKLAESRLGMGVRFDPICAEELFSTLCGEGELSSCFQLGTLKREGVLAFEDVAAGNALIERACNQGEYKACLDVVMRDKKSDDEGKRKLVELAFEAATKACAAEDADACLELRSAYDRAGQWYYLKTAEKDVAKQLEVTQRACALGSSDACALLDRSERPDVYKDHCDEEPAACVRVPGLADKSQYQDWLYRRCAAGWDSGCEGLLSRSYRFAKPTPEAKAVHAALLEASCLEGTAGACGVLSSRLMPFERSDKVLQTGCELGLADSCEELAKKAADAGDRQMELSLLERACPVVTPQGRASMSRSACRVAGIMYKDGVGAPQDLGRAAILLQKGCLEQGYVLDGQACLVLGEMFEDGLGVTKSLSRALDLYAAGCAYERYEGAVLARAERRAGHPPGSDPVPRPRGIEPTACTRLRKWVTPPTDKSSGAKREQ